MANQPTKYSKFLVGAASAALVATAVAPVASAAGFTDTESSTHKDAINDLVKLGIANGYKDGTFQPNKELTRADVVKFLGKWLVSQGKEIPADAVSNPRFKDLKSTNEKELLEYAAIVYDNGVFKGSNGNLLASHKMTRQNMANVIVRAFDNVKDLDLVKYVESQKDFTGDVKDLSTAYEDTRGAIKVVDFFDITDPSVANFRPKDATTRGQFASFLNRALNTDFSVVNATGAVKAINATTVEITFPEVVSDVNALKYTIEGLTVSNAAVKQTDNKTVVLTTSVQEGGKEYTVKAGETTLGKFTGLSAVIPTKITTDSTSLQGVVGKEVTLKADINVKQAGVPVTFNVTADDKLNKDQVVEAVTNAEGIATYSYTQYAAGNDDVAVYATGAPSVRANAKVYWGVDSILTIAADDKKGDAVNNGENKVYKVTYKDAKSGKVVANQKLNVTFAENVDTTIDKVTPATANGKNPYQLENGKTEFVTITTNSKGEATLTVSGLNTKATPVVFLDDAVNNRVAGNNRLEATELQAKAAQLVIGAVQSSYVLDVVRDGKEEAATGLDNGRKYKVAVKTKDGKVAANETVNVAFNEDVDRNMSTNTKAVFIKDKKIHPDNKGKQITIKLNDKGEGSFTIASDSEKDYATPVVWIDINSSNAKDGTLDEGEPTKVADITYFAKAVLTDGNVKAYDSATSNANEIDEDDKFEGNKTAYFKFNAANQSGNKMPLPTGYDRIETTFTVFNTGSNDVTVKSVGNIDEIVSPNRSVTVSVTANEPMISVDSANKTTDVRVEASGTALPTSYRNNNNNSWNNNNNWNWNNNSPVNLGNHTAKVSFVSTLDIGVIHTGIVKSIDVKEKEIEFDGKTVISYKGASFKNVNANTINESEFVKLVQDNLGTIKVTVTKDKDSGKYTFEIVSLNPNLSSVLDTINDATSADSAVIDALKNSGFLPAFSTLKADQQQALATDVITKRGTRDFTESRLKTAYESAYETVVNAAIAAVKATPGAATLERVPGLNLVAYKALSDADKEVVNAKLKNGTYSTVATLETALATAISAEPVLAALEKVNTASADTIRVVLEENASVLKLDQSVYSGLSSVQRDAVAANVHAGKPLAGYTELGIKNAFTLAVNNVTDKVAPVLEGVIFTDGTKLTLTFNEAVNVSSLVDLTVIDAAGTNVAVGTLSSVIADGNKLVITLPITTEVKVGQILKTLTIKDLAGNALVVPTSGYVIK